MDLSVVCLEKAEDTLNFKGPHWCIDNVAGCGFTFLLVACCHFGIMTSWFTVSHLRPYVDLDIQVI